MPAADPPSGWQLPADRLDALAERRWGDVRGSPYAHDMSSSQASAQRAPVLRRILAGGWSGGLFLIGSAVDLIGVINVPGGAEFGADGQLALTDAGTAWVLLAVAAWATVFWRRRVPLLALAAGVVLLLVGVSYLLFLVGLLEALSAWRARARAIAAVGIIGVAFYVVRELVTPWGGALVYLFTDDPPVSAAHRIASGVLCVVVGIIALGLTLVLHLYGRSRSEADSSRRLAAREQRRADELSVEVARQHERESLARDIHDTLASGLSVLSLQAGALEMNAERAAPEELRARARSLREQAHSALEDLRVLLGGLRSSPGPAGAATSLRSIGALLRKYREGGTPIDAYVLIEDADRASASLEAALYRIVQESLTNAVKHAPGAPVSLYLETSSANGARIRVSNPVTGVALGAPGAGQGTRGIRDRAQELEGTAWIGEHGGAFVVDVSLPWAEDA
jgi:signal transduction histidine kinase